MYCYIQHPRQTKHGHWGVIIYGIKFTFLFGERFLIRHRDKNVGAKNEKQQTQPLRIESGIRVGRVTMQVLHRTYSGFWSAFPKSTPWWFL